MHKIKSLADQLRDQMSGSQMMPVSKLAKAQVISPVKKTKILQANGLIQDIMEYDSSSNRAMVHVKLDDHTAKLVNHFKMASGVDNIRLVAFAVKHLFDNNPELKSFIKQYTQNLEL